MTILAASLLLVTSPGPTIEVVGNGYLRLLRDGRAVYAKSAKLSVSQGRLANEFGDTFLPSITLADASGITVSKDGTVSNGSGQLGKLTLAVFPEGAALTDRDGVKISTERPRLVYGDGDGPLWVRMATTKERTSEPPRTSAGSPNRVAGPAVFQVKTAVELSNDSMTIADLVEDAGAYQNQFARINLGPTPMLGVTRRFDREFLLGKLRLAGLNVRDFNWNQTEPVSVTRKGIKIPQQEFVAAATAEILRRNPGGEFACRTDSAETIVPVGDYELRTEDVSGLGTSAVSVRVGIFHQDGSSWRRLNSRTIKFDSKVQPLLVRTGKKIQVIMRSGGASIVLSGTARSDGILGASVSVEVQPGDRAPKTTHVGVVKGPDLVEISL